MYWWYLDNSRVQWRKIGLSKSNCKCPSQFAALTKGGPWPIVEYASLTPSFVVQNLIFCSRRTISLCYRSPERFKIAGTKCASYFLTEWSSRLMSIASAEFVVDPTEITSTPVLT